MLRRLLIVLGVAAVSAGAMPAAAGAVPRGGDRFETEQNRYLLGQAPDWLDARRVVFHDPFLRDDGADNQIHIHRSTLGGKRRVCLTCGLEGPHRCRWSSRAASGSCFTRGTATASGWGERASAGSGPTYG